MAKEWYFLGPKLSLAKLDVKLVLSQPLKYNSEVFFVFLQSLRINKNIVKEYHDKLFQI
jgi:hypothetical protein